MHDLIPLQNLNAGQMAEVEQLVGLPEQVHRLEELGLRSGAQVEMVRNGRPCIVRLDGAQLCFRDNEMCGILVRPGVDA